MEFDCLIKEIIKHGLQSNTYILRGKILIKLFELKKSNFGNIYYCDCDTQISWLANKIFKTSPSMTERAICAVCSNRAERKLVTLSIKDTEFVNCAAETLIKKNCFLEKTPCLECVRKAESRGSCNDKLRNDPRVRHEIHDMGKYIIELYITFEYKSIFLTV